MSAKSGNSWSHALRLLGDSEARYGRTCGMRRNGQRCGQDVTHAQSYEYVTGRAGRVSTSERMVCAGHAQRFATKHDVPMPDAPSARPGRALDQALDQLGLSAGDPMGTTTTSADSPPAVQRAIEYAALFLTAGDRWRDVVPVDAEVIDDRVYLDGVQLWPEDNAWHVGDGNGGHWAYRLPADAGEATR